MQPVYSPFTQDYKAHCHSQCGGGSMAAAAAAQLSPLGANTTPHTCLLTFHIDTTLCSTAHTSAVVAAAFVLLSIVPVARAAMR